jgi:hypothetical protein
LWKRLEIPLIVVNVARKGEFMRKLLRKLLFSAALFLAFMQNSYAGKAQDFVAQNPWHSDGNISVARALTKGGARGCGHFEYIQVKSSEYIVRCGFADEGYQYYVAWTSAEKTIGPYTAIEKLLEVAY